MRTLLASFLFLVVGCGGSVDNSSAVDAAPDTATLHDTGSASDTGSTSDAAPSDGGVAFDRCNGPAQCILAITDCCGKCGETAITDYHAIHRDRASAHRASVCTDPGFGCPDCISSKSPNLVAFCRGERCVGVDVRTDAISECATDSDCMLRTGNDCCESCGVSDPSQLIALSKAKGSELTAQVCDPLAGACPPCVPVYPPDVAATCDPVAKRCRVTVK